MRGATEGAQHSVGCFPQSQVSNTSPRFCSSLQVMRVCLEKLWAKHAGTEPAAPQCFTVISQGFLGLPSLPSPSKDAKGPKGDASQDIGHLCVALQGGKASGLSGPVMRSWCPCTQRSSNKQQRNTGVGILVTSSSPTVHPDSVPPRAVRGEELVPCYLAIT